VSSVALFATLLALVGCLRIAEVVVSWRRLRARPAVPEPGLFPAMVALHASLIGLPLLEVVELGRPVVPALAIGAGALLALATALRVWTLRTIGRAWNVRVVVPDAGAIVRDGPYAWIRHPNYLVVILEVAALPLLHDAWLSALVLSTWNGLVLARRIATEEAALSQVPAWREAMAGRARLIPGVF
jgi:methyltransferase